MTDDTAVHTAVEAVDLLALADRVEALSGPDREVDAEIMATQFTRDRRFIGGRDAYSNEHVKDSVWVDPATDKWVSTAAYHFTASLDDAMRLVPEGIGFNLSRYWIASREGPAWSCEISTGGLPDKPRQVFDCYDAHSPALAVAAAALRARAAL